MAPRKPKPKFTQEVRSNPARVSKSKSSAPPVEKHNGYRMRRYRNGILNLEKAPAHLVASIKSNTESSLLRLPAEIRNRIWSFACGDQRVILPARWNTTEKGGGVRFNTEQSQALLSCNYDCRESKTCRMAADRTLSIFHLPEVCRQIYAETALTSYRESIFVCDITYINRKNPMSWLIVAQRRAITILEPMPEFLSLMSYPYSGKVIERIINMLPNMRTFLVTPAALRYVQKNKSRSNPENTTAWDQDQWRAWLADSLKQHGDFEVVFEE